MRKHREIQLEIQLASALTALNDLHNGHSWRDTGIDLKTMLAQAEALGVTVRTEAEPSS